MLDQNCESRQALDRIADKWTCLVVYALVDGPRRHGELRRTIDGISQKMLTQTLRSMEADGLVQRTVFDVVPPHVEYRADAAGRDAEGAARRDLPLGDGPPARAAGRTLDAQRVEEYVPPNSIRHYRIAVPITSGEERWSSYSLASALCAETLGTALLVLVGPGSVVATLVLAGDSTPAVTGADLLGISFAFGLIITALVYALGKVSGCHINPAVTFALAATKRFPWREVPAYWARAGRSAPCSARSHLGRVRASGDRPRDGADLVQRGHHHVGGRRSSPRASARSC